MTGYIQPSELVEKKLPFCILKIEKREQPNKPENRRIEWFYTIIVDTGFYYEEKYLTFWYYRQNGSVHEKNLQLATLLGRRVHDCHWMQLHLLNGTYKEYSVTNHQESSNPNAICPCNAFQQLKSEAKELYPELTPSPLKTFKDLCIETGVMQYQIAAYSGLSMRAVERVWRMKPKDQSESLQLLGYLNSIRIGKGLPEIKENEVHWTNQEVSSIN